VLRKNTNPGSVAPAFSRRFGRRARVATAVALAALCAGAVAAKLLADRWMQREAAHRLAEVLPKLEKRTGLRFTTGPAQFGLNGSTVLNEVTAADPNDAAPFFTVDKLDVHFDLDLKTKTATINELRLKHPRLTAVIAATGALKWPDAVARLFAEAKGKAKDRAEEPLVFAHGRVRIADALTVKFDAGEIVLRDEGRYLAQPGALLQVAQAVGAARVDLPARAADIAGQAKEPAGGGRFDFTVSAQRGRTTATFLCRELPLVALAPFAPPALRLTPSARLTGKTTVTIDKTQRTWRIETDSRAAGLTLSHPRLGPEEIHDVAGSLRGELELNPADKTVTARELELRLGDAPFYLLDSTVRHDRKAPFLAQTKLVARGVKLQDVLDGLPADLIPIIKGAKVEGFLDLRVGLILDMGNPSRSNLEVDGDVTQFRAVSIPERCDVRRLERLDFKHLARKKGELQAEIVVGPSNPDFVALPSVGPLVVGAVLTCEDGSFFRHNGFMLRHINDSLRRDLHEKRFARGASTVSMQLVKNVFLNEQKTLSRKLQEMMLTWWLEKEVKKDRILETYLNIIEWGPKIYGVGPAARHYFHARPNELTPIQAAFLASIIANPVRYYYMKQRGVGDGWRINLEFILRKLVERGTIAQEDYDAAAATDFDVPFEKPPDAGDKTENPPAAKKSAPTGPTDASPAPAKPAPKKPAPKAAPPPNPPIDL